VGLVENFYVTPLPLLVRGPLNGLFFFFFFFFFLEI
jgi:hypothetical protein